MRNIILWIISLLVVCYGIYYWWSPKIEYRYIHISNSSPYDIKPANIFDVTDDNSIVTYAIDNGVYRRFDVESNVTDIIEDDAKGMSLKVAVNCTGYFNKDIPCDNINYTLFVKPGTMFRQYVID